MDRLFINGYFDYIGLTVGLDFRFIEERDPEYDRSVAYAKRVYWTDIFPVIEFRITAGIFKARYRVPEVPGRFTSKPAECTGMTAHAETDRAIGLSILFGLLAVVGAILIYVAPTQSLSAIGFGGAVVSGSLAIVAFGYYT